MTTKEKTFEAAKQIKIKLETQLIDFKPRYYYEFPNMYIEIGEFVFIVHLICPKPENPKYILINEKSYVDYDRDFIVGVIMSKEGNFIITGFCLEDELEFYSKPSPYPNPYSPCYGIPICKLKNITNLTNIIKQKVINISNKRTQ